MALLGALSHPGFCPGIMILFWEQVTPKTSMHSQEGYPRIDVILDKNINVGFGRFFAPGIGPEKPCPHHGLLLLLATLWVW